MRTVAAILGLGIGLLGQKWQDTCGKTPAGSVQLRQAARDAGSDTLALLVASHPDDRYVLPASWLSFCHGYRIAVLLATRGGGGQNSSGPETGDALERIRTLETEAGCSHFHGDTWYLGRPDGGYRRTAEETFAEWGRDATLREMARLIRRIRPDVIATTHNAEESHGHDLALVDLLPRAVQLAKDPTFVTDAPPHTVRAFLLGGASANPPNLIRVSADQLEPDRGSTLRRLAYEVLRDAHISPGAPAPIETVFEPEIRFEPQFLGEPAVGSGPFGKLPSVFDADLWPGSREEAVRLDTFLSQELPDLVVRHEPPVAAVEKVLARLRELAQQHAAGELVPDDDLTLRLRRRIEALERLLLHLIGVQVEVDTPPGTVGVAGEEFVVTVHLHSGPDLKTTLRAEGLEGVDVQLETFDGRDLLVAAPGPVRANATIRMPLRPGRGDDPMQARFHADRFQPPVRVRFLVGVDGLEIPAVVTVPVEERAPVELSVVPRMLLLPTARRAVQFSVSVVRNSQFPVDDEIEVRAPAGYATQQDRRHVTLREQRGDLFGFEVLAADEKKAGVDVLRISLGKTRVVLPVHKVDVKIPGSLRVGVVRSRDDTLPGVLGVGGFGLSWSELSDTDIAIADLLQFDSIVVDVRALRDRPAARRGFRRLLEFAANRGHRLVVFYQKDVEFHPAGEGFIGAPFAPFQVGKARVTRSDAPVRVLLPDHVLMRSPNPILPSDWDGWEQERGLYFPSVYSGQYQELLEMQDPGQPVEHGALLYAQTGEGEYVYCALSLWRQLKKLHPGAVRLLANLLTPRTFS
jgi:LmbE family N-acetylglucosaminyl deacetylase